MALIGRLHPLLIHFPIALVMVALGAETGFIVTGHHGWRITSVFNIRIASLFTVAATVAGWWLALGPEVEATQLLAWHRWIGITGACLTVAAAALTSDAAIRSPARLKVYRVALSGAAALVAFAGHLGGVMVWGADFLRL